MKRMILFRVALVLGLVAALLGSSGVAQASARTASWVVSVTYQNVGSGAASVLVRFYAEGSGTPIQFNPLGAGTLPQGAGASFFIGSVSGINPGFRGSAVMESSQPLVATVVQFSNDPGFKMRLLSNGFTTTDASNQYLIATALWNKYNRTTVFSIQNAEDSAVRATVNLYDADAGGALAATKTYTIPQGSSKYIEMDNAATTGLAGSSFNGSAIITAVLDSDGTTPAKVVAAASEYSINSNVAANFEGVPLTKAGNTLYMATALCQKFDMDTFYAIQNASLTDSASVTVEYYDLAGNLATTDGPYDIGHGQKKSVSTCSPSSGAAMSGFTGSAKVTSTGAPIVAVGKAQGSAGVTATADVYTAFLGEPQGFSKLAMPFIRYSNDTNYNAAGNVGSKQRTYIAVQNLGTDAAKANVKYFDKAGNLVATQVLSIAGKSKANSDAGNAGALGKSGMVAGEFGYYTDNTYGGAVIVEAHPDNPSAKFIAIARSQHPGAAEDYNAVSVP